MYRAISQSNLAGRAVQSYRRRPFHGGAVAIDEIMVIGGQNESDRGGPVEKRFLSGTRDATGDAAPGCARGVVGDGGMSHERMKGVGSTIERLGDRHGGRMYGGGVVQQA